MPSFVKIASLVREETYGFHPPSVAASFAARSIPPQSFGRVRAAIYRAFGVSIGERTLINGALTLGGARHMRKNLKIGSGCRFNAYIYLDLNAPVMIGNGVCIGNHAIVVTSAHELGPSGLRAAALKPKPVTIENGAWVGAGAMILPGVTIGAGAVVAAGAVVSKDVAPNTLVGGVPAKLIRELD